MTCPTAKGDRDKSPAKRNSCEKLPFRQKLKSPYNRMCTDVNMHALYSVQYSNVCTGVHMYALYSVQNINVVTFQSTDLTMSCDHSWGKKALNKTFPSDLPYCKGR